MFHDFVKKKELSIKGGVRKGNRSYVDAKTQRESAGCGLNLAGNR